MSSRRTAQELADECKRLADALMGARAIEAMTRGSGVAVAGALAATEAVKAELHETIDKIRDLAAIASQAEPVGQTVELEKLAREIVKLHKERGCVLTVHVEQMADLLGHIGEPAATATHVGEVVSDVDDGVVWNEVEWVTHPNNLPAGTKLYTTPPVAPLSTVYRREQVAKEMAPVYKAFDGITPPAPAQAELPHEHDGETAPAVGNLIFALERWKATSPRTAPPAWAALVRACSDLVAAAATERAEQSEDGVDAARWRFVGDCGNDYGVLRRDPHGQWVHVTANEIDAAIAAKEQQS